MYHVGYHVGWKIDKRGHGGGVEEKGVKGILKGIDGISLFSINKVDCRVTPNGNYLASRGSREGEYPSASYVSYPPTIRQKPERSGKEEPGIPDDQLINRC